LFLKPLSPITEIVGPELKQLTKHLDRWGSTLAIETFASFDIWAEQSASTSLMSNEMAGKHSDHYYCRCQANKVTKIFYYFLNEKPNTA
jgi:hypothetical protein